VDTLTSEKTEGYIYGLFDPRAYCYPRYIGKAIDVDSRLRQHLQPSQLKAKTKKNSWIKSLLTQGVKPLIHILEIVELEKLDEAERNHIATWRSNIGGLLTNGTYGGTGGAVTDPAAKERHRKALTGRKASEETRRKMSETHKIRLADPQVRKQMSETSKRVGSKPPTNYGESNPTAKLTDEQVRQIRERSLAGIVGVLIAKDFEISQAHVTDIVIGKTRIEAGGPIREPKVKQKVFDWSEAKRLRDQEGWSQSKIARHLGVDQAQVSRKLRDLDKNIE
jgi:hypothetical protein